MDNTDPSFVSEPLAGPEQPETKGTYSTEMGSTSASRKIGIYERPERAGGYSRLIISLVALVILIIVAIIVIQFVF